MQRSLMPSSSHFLAIEVTRGGQPDRLAIHVSISLTNADCRRKRWRLGRTSVPYCRRAQSVGRLGQRDRVDATILALVAPRMIETTVRAYSNDVAVRQEATIIRRIHLLEDPLCYQSPLFEAPEKMLSEFMVLPRRGPAEMAE
jgi:hypothetical protein